METTHKATRNLDGSYTYRGFQILDDSHPHGFTGPAWIVRTRQGLTPTFAQGEFSTLAEAKAAVDAWRNR